MGSLLVDVSDLENFHLFLLCLLLSLAFYTEKLGYSFGHYSMSYFLKCLMSALLCSLGYYINVQM